eukprot:m.130722 g.130722  ORF g.130722 m.130722 type:complete len:133 (-) comp14606_c0_seq8:6242-6640(-)
MCLGRRWFSIQYLESQRFGTLEALGGNDPFHTSMRGYDFQSQSPWGQSDFKSVADAALMAQLIFKVAEFTKTANDALAYYFLAIPGHLTSFQTFLGDARPDESGAKLQFQGVWAQLKVCLSSIQHMLYHKVQ